MRESSTARTSRGSGIARWSWALAALLALGGGALSASAAPDALSGRWSAALQIPAGDVEFGLELRLAGQAVSGSILNGEEAQALSGGSFDGSALELRLDYYDGVITARFADESRKTLVGEYARQTRSGIGRYPFRATAGAPPAAAAGGDRKALGAADIAGEWLVSILAEDGSVDEVNEATFTLGAVGPKRAAVSGAIIPVSGDSGLLSGAVTASAGAPPAFRLSRFDGIHVTLLSGEVRPDGALAGEIASGLSSRVKFTAVRKGAAPPELRPEDPYTATRVRDPAARFAFSIPGPDGGAPVTLEDARYRGKVVVIDIMGTWCPNCHDAAPLLVELDRKYRAAGLEIVSLAYEYTEDAARSQRQIAIFRQKYGIEFPILLAGKLADGEVERTLPQLDGFRAYPTAIFVGRDGRARKIHAGFSGPATGDRFGELKGEFEELIRELLAESAPS